MSIRGISFSPLLLYVVQNSLFAETSFLLSNVSKCPEITDIYGTFSQKILMATQKLVICISGEMKSWLLLFSHSHVWLLLFATPGTGWYHQDCLSSYSARKLEWWLFFFRDLPNPGDDQPSSPTLQMDSFTSEPLGEAWRSCIMIYSLKSKK